MAFRNKGNILPCGSANFAEMVSSVLGGRLTDRRASIKEVARWTGASERAVKNWFAGTRGPSGDHFCKIVSNCPEMLYAFLHAANRTDCIAMANVVNARRSLQNALEVLERIRLATEVDLPDPPGSEHC